MKLVKNNVQRTKDLIHDRIVRKHYGYDRTSNTESIRVDVRHHINIVKQTVRWILIGNMKHIVFEPK